MIIIIKEIPIRDKQALGYLGIICKIILAINKIRMNFYVNITKKLEKNRYLLGMILFIFDGTALKSEGTFETNIRYYHNNCTPEINISYYFNNCTTLEKLISTLSFLLFFYPPLDRSHLFLKSGSR